MLIQNDTQLRKYLPNALATCEGEMSLYTKLLPDLLAAEAWLTRQFVAPSSINSIPEDSVKETALNLARRIVVAEALLRAVPQLDLVLTPNGFGIVSNNNIVPASKDRVDRLLLSLEKVRDRTLQQLLPMLYLVNGCMWYKSEQGLYFGGTLFPFLDLSELMGETDHLWLKYQQLQPQVVLIEQELADKYISLPIYDRLRNHLLTGSVSLVERDLITRLRSIEVELLKGKPLNMPTILALVNFLRTNSTDFPEWATSETAKLYQLQSFNNTKTSHGYWF